MKSSTNRALVAKKQFTFSAQVANSIRKVLQGCSKSIRLLLVMFLTLTVSANAWGADTWELVTDASNLAAGDEVVIVANSANYALSTTQNSNNRGQASVTKNANTTPKTVSWTGNSVQVLTLKTGKTSGSLAFYTGSGYLYAASSSSNHLKTETNLSNNSSWSISITSAGVATIKAQGDNSRNWLRYNSSSSIFSCYGSGQGDVCIYKKSGGSTTYYTTSPQCTTEPSQLAKPTNLQVTNITSTSATLSWNAVTYATSYTVQVYGENDEIIAEYTDLTQTTKEVSGLESDTYYIWAVTAIGDGTTYTDSEESETADFTTLTACEKLGAATNLAVVTNYVQDGQTYVKFSWTPAAPSKEGTTQELCYGLVGQEKTCKESAKNLGEAKGVASNLPAGEYEWSIQAIGDGNNYCDGDVVEGTNFYIYSITYNTNGGNTIAATSGTTLPDPLPTPTREHYNFEGWYTNSELTIAATAGAAITQNTTLYAKWTAKTYIITLDANGGTFVDNRDSQTKGSATFDYIYGTYANYNDAPNLTEYYSDLKRDGYQFDKWVSGGSPWNKLFTSTGDRTIQAQWSKLYSITLSENGTPTTPTTQTSTSYTLPTELSAGSCQDDTKELVGWSTVAIPNPGDKPTSKFYELGETVTLTEDQTTFYAVFATAEGDGSAEGWTLTSNGLADLTSSDVFVFAVSVSGTYYAMPNDGGTSSSPELTAITVTSNKIRSEVGSQLKWNISGDATNGYIFYPDGSTTKWMYCNTTASSSSNDNIRVGTGTRKAWKQNSSTKYLYNDDNTTRYLSRNGTTDFRSYVNTNNNPIVPKVFRYNAGTTYSDYSTTCVKLPDPVLSFATEPANPIVFTDAVCGGNSSKQSVTVVGENLRDVVEVSVTGPYKIARTASTALKDFTTSLTLDKTAVGAIHSNYQTVYIISTPPAQSTEATTGTLTLTTTKGNTLTVNLSTPTVTCTQYTLTLVDRDVPTEQPTKYYAGETINEAPADPEGVCTDPIHYVFDGWAEATVAADATTYDKVTFPYTVEGNTTFHAVYRYVEEGSGDSGDYVKVTDNLDDYSGDYLFVYETGNVAFDGGRNNVDDELDATSNTIEVTINDNTIASNATTDAAKFTIAKVDGGYSIQSASGYYIGWSTADKNGLNANSKYSVNYYLNTISNSIISGVKGTLKFNKTSGQERFRYYQSGQEAIALYRKAASYLYTTSPICGPHLVVTEGKDIYVTGGNAGGTRDLVIAQQKVSYKATRLQTSNGLTDGTAPDVKVATNGITVGGVVTSDVKVTIDQTKEQQTDGTYTITGTVTVQYQPSANNKQEDIQVQLAVDYNAEARDNFTVHARSLPAEFVIVAKSGDKWYALNGDMNTNAANPANGQVTLNDLNNPTEATFAPCNAIYTFDGLPNTGDRIYVRFQGTDGAWLWASSGTNVGIQNNGLKDTPAGDNKAYNWKLYTEDNITYRFGNANSSRQLTLNGEKFGMYASGVQDIRILPYEAKCLYNYAPTNLKVSVLKGSYVTLTWDAVAGATKYQYSTDATNWTDCGTEPTVTINGLDGATKYTYYIRAYHEDADVSRECIDYAEITFTTANCDDVPTDITYSADMNSIIVSWIANAATSTVNLYSDEEAEVLVATQSVASPCTFTDLAKNTQYYVQILANGICASPIVPVKTEDVEVDIVEWYPQGIIVDINTDKTVGVTLENEVSYGSGMGTEATELFFSKYYEASYNVKLVAIYNGTKNIIDLTDYTIQYGKTSWESNYITLKDFGATKGQIQPGEEIILYSYTENDTDDKKILDCVHEHYPDGNWVRVTSSNNDGKGTLSFGGDKTIILCKKEYDDEEDKYYDNIIDVIGALKNDPNEGILPTNTATEEPSWGDKEGWVCETGLSIADDSQIGISTNRCLLIRNNTVTSGDNAVASNMNDFVTLCTEWKGAHVPDNDIDNGVQASCDNFAYVGTFDYSDYYTKYETMGDEKVFDQNARNADGTVTIPITDLYKHACSNIRVKLTNSNSDVLTDREYKVPIMITTTQGTDGQTFIDLQQNLATKEVDGEGNVIATHPLSLAEVREICKTCDVVVRDNATLTKVTDGTTNDHPQVRNVYVYEGASIVIPDGSNHNYTINGLSLRRKGDVVASAQVQGTGKFVLPADEPVCLDLRVDANNWHWFTLPFDCDIADVTWIDGTPAKYNTDWFLMYYDGESRAASTNPYDNHWKVYNGTTIEAGKGYIVGITGDLAHPNYTFELRFPMAQGVLTEEQTNKTVPVNAWGVKSDNKPNNLGWNLVGNPYLNYYKTADEYSLAGLPLIEYTGIDPVTGDRLYNDNGDIPFLVTPIDGGWYEYRQELASEVNMMPFTAYFVQVGDTETHTNGQALNASFEASNRGKKSIVRRAPRELEEIEEPIIVRVELTNSKGESDKTSLVIDDRFTNEYEMNGDFFKWFGDYYNYYTKPVLYTIGADQGKRAFNALNEELAKQPIPMGMYAAQAGNYTFSLNQQFDLSRVEEVWLYDATQSTYTNLMQSDYTFSTSKVNGAGRFSLSVKLAPKVATSIDNVTADKVWATTHTKQIIVNGLDSSMHLWLYDATGKLLYTEPTSNYQHTYSVPQTGTYFVSVMKGNAKQTIKVVVE